MLIKKITTGFVMQTFNEDGICVEQNFTAGEVEYEDENGNPLDDDVHDEHIDREQYFPFNMIQPEKV